MFEAGIELYVFSEPFAQLMFLYHLSQVLVFIIILYEACRFAYLPFWLRCWLRVLRYVKVVVQFSIFGFVCVILPPILVEVLASRFAVTILLSFDFLGIFVLFGCIVLTSRFVVLPNCTPPVRLVLLLTI